MQADLTHPPSRIYTAFAGFRSIAAGELPSVASSVKQAIDGGGLEPVLVFDDTSGSQVDLDLSGSVADVEARYSVCSAGEPATESLRGPGRPKLGVIAREVTLLPRHWEWLNSQPGGASVTIRKLVEEARRTGAAGDAKRQSRDAAYRFMTSLAGNMPGYEEAVRALFAGDAEKFTLLTGDWPPDVARHAARLAGASFSS